MTECPSFPLRLTTSIACSTGASPMESLNHRPSSGSFPVRNREMWAGSWTKDGGVADGPKMGATTSSSFFDHEATGIPFSSLRSSG